jgi:hypothetical protein
MLSWRGQEQLDLQLISAVDAQESTAEETSRRVGSVGMSVSGVVRVFIVYSVFSRQLLCVGR